METWTKNNNVKLIYDAVTMRENPMHYSYGTMEKTNFYGHNTKNSHMCIHEIEQCYAQKRLIFDDGG